MSQKQFDRKIDEITLCGKNRGPHDYIPMSWIKSATSEHVSHLLCRICFTRINVQTLTQLFPEVGADLLVSK